MTKSELLEEMGLLRLPEVLKIFPVSRSSWWSGISGGRFPKPVKLGPRAVAWRARDIKNLLERITSEGEV